VIPAKQDYGLMKTENPASFVKKPTTHGAEEDRSAVYADPVWRNVSQVFALRFKL
jgi:hypothetical protein